MYLWDDNVNVCVSPGGYHLCSCGMTTSMCVCVTWWLPPVYLWDDNVSVCVSPGGYHLCVCGMTTLVCVCHLVVTTCVSVG